MAIKSLIPYEVYVDGSAKGNGTSHSCGGWAYCILYDGDVIRKESGTVVDTTNSRMELMAMLKGLKACEMFGDEHSVYHIYSDSAYIINCCYKSWYLAWEKNGWVNSKKELVAHSDLWCQIIPYFKRKSFFFHKVKAHADNYYNNLVDQMAQAAADPLLFRGTRDGTDR